MDLKVHQCDDFVFLFRLFVTHWMHRFKRLHRIILVLLMSFLVILILESNFSNFDFKTVLFHGLNWNISRWSFSGMFRRTLGSLIWFIIKLHQLTDSFKLIGFFGNFFLPFLKLFQRLTGQMTVLLGADKFQLKFFIKLMCGVCWLGKTFGAVFVYHWSAAIFYWNFQGFFEFFLVFVQVNPISSQYTVVRFPTSQIFVFDV